MKNLMKSLLFIGILLTLFHKSASSNVDCKYENETFFAIGQVYKCNVNKNLHIESLDNATITSETGTHLEGKGNNDVDAFDGDGVFVEYFPFGLEKLFPNLKVISFNFNTIKKVNQSDFKPFPNLEGLWLGYNLIEVIEEDLFKFNPKLKLVSFSDNPVTHIDPNVFDDLNGLKYLWFGSVSCMNERAFDNSTAVKEVIRIGRSKCIDTKYSILDEKIKNLETRHDSLNSAEFNQQLAELEENFKVSNYSNSSSFQKRIKKLHETKEAEESGAKEAQTVNVQDQIAQIHLKLKEIGEILSNISKQLEAKQ